MSPRPCVWAHMHTHTILRPHPIHIHGDSDLVPKAVLLSDKRNWVRTLGSFPHQWATLVVADTVDRVELTLHAQDGHVSTLRARTGANGP